MTKDDFYHPLSERAVWALTVADSDAVDAAAGDRRLAAERLAEPYRRLAYEAWSRSFMSGLQSDLDQARSWAAKYDGPKIYG